MRRSAILALLLAVPASVLSQPAEPNGPPPGFTEGQPPPEGPPAQVPPPPAEVAPPAEAAPQPSAAPAGQWVYTNQYGWLWMPYGREFAYVPEDPKAYPDQYVYYPAYGWRWVVAPWIYGYGPAPYWGGPGLRLFAWYSHPWFRVGGYWGWGGYRGWGHYRGWVGPRAWGARGWAGAPVYYRSGVGGPHPHAFRPAPVRRGVEREHRREERREERR